MTHEISIVTPIYSKDLRQAVCSCSWTSDELPSGGKATLAGLQHVNSQPADTAGSPSKPDLGTETSAVDSGMA